MKPDQISGWELMAVQVVALVVVAVTLWAMGLAFRRSRVARVATLLLAPVAGAAIALGVLGADESVVSSYLFALVLFALGTLAMSVMLLAAIPRTRAAALGGLAFGSLVIVAFVLTYYAVFTFGRPRWITHPIGGLVRVNDDPTPAVTPSRPGMHKNACELEWLSRPVTPRRIRASQV